METTVCARSTDDTRRRLNISVSILLVVVIEKVSWCWAIGSGGGGGRTFIYCPPLPAVINSYIMYDTGTVGNEPGKGNGYERHGEGAVGTYVCHRRYKISVDSASSGVSHYDSVKFACVPEFITFNYEAYKARKNISYICSRQTNGQGHWTIFRRYHQYSPYDDDNDDDDGKSHNRLRLSSNDRRQLQSTKLNQYGGKAYPTFTYGSQMWSVEAEPSTFWTRLARNVDDRFLLKLAGFTIVVMLSLVLRGIYRTFCIFNISINAPDHHLHQPRPRESPEFLQLHVHRHMFSPGLVHLPPPPQQQHHNLVHVASTSAAGSASVIPPEQAPAEVSLPTYEEATGLPSYNDVFK